MKATRINLITLCMEFLSLPPSDCHRFGRRIGVIEESTPAYLNPTDEKALEQKDYIFKKAIANKKEVELSVFINERKNRSRREQNLHN